MRCSTCVLDPMTCLNHLNIWIPATTQHRHKHHQVLSSHHLSILIILDLAANINHILPSHLESLPQRHWRGPLLLKVISLKQTSVHHYQQLHLLYCSSVSRHPLISSLSSSAAETLIHAFITSRIDCRSSILYGASSKVPNSNTSRALLFAGRPPLHPRPHRPVLHNLHWAWLLFKVPLLTYKVHHNQAFLTNLLHRHTPSRSLCFSDVNLLSPPLRTRHRTWSKRAFCP